MRFLTLIPILCIPGLVRSQSGFRNEALLRNYKDSAILINAIDNKLKLKGIAQIDSVQFLSGLCYFEWNAEKQSLWIKAARFGEMDTLLLFFDGSRRKIPVRMLRLPSFEPKLGTRTDSVITPDYLKYKENQLVTLYFPGMQQIYHYTKDIFRLQLTFYDYSGIKITQTERFSGPIPFESIQRIICDKTISRVKISALYHCSRLTERMFYIRREG